MFFLCCCERFFQSAYRNLFLSISSDLSTCGCSFLPACRSFFLFTCKSPPVAVYLCSPEDDPFNSSVEFSFWSFRGSLLTSWKRVFLLSSVLFSSSCGTSLSSSWFLHFRFPYIFSQSQSDLSLQDNCSDLEFILKVLSIHPVVGRLFKLLFEQSVRRGRWPYIVQMIPARWLFQDISALLKKHLHFNKYSVTRMIESNFDILKRQSNNMFCLWIF